MSTETPTVESVLNLTEAMTNLDGDAELLQEIMEIFLETAEDQFDAIDVGIQAGDISQVAIDAHGMKGGASNFCATNFVQAALTLERRAKEGNLEGASELLAKMKTAFADLQEVAKVINWQEVENNWEG